MSGFHFHHHGHEHDHAHHVAPEHQRIMRWASYASVAMALALMGGKLVAWWLSDSLSMLSSLTDSLFDVITSLINMCALRYALKPADEDHRFGHSAIEDIAGLAQAAFIGAGMLLIILQSFERLANPQPLSHESIGMWVSGIAMLFTIALVIFQTIVAKRTGSLIVAADRMHYVGDIAFNLGVVAALYLSSRLGWLWADPVFAIGIAIAILWATRSIGIRAFNNLMDREMPEAEKTKIIDVVHTVPEIRGVHQFKTRYSGTKSFMQMHIDLPGNLSFQEAHDITDRLERKLAQAFPGADIIIHPDVEHAHDHHD
jgi:ferrous-iron efflux pump FieF